CSAKFEQRSVGRRAAEKQEEEAAHARLCVIDRYINHSCSPNCITEVVSVEKENKIIISSCRRIQRGEELSYDYKFDLEDDQHKIPCHCGAVNCRKWMN
ncbi:histone-lysine N-methyltransferase trr-like, partial [Plectropomus leopardus]|uniref:histone-lysine N-methyltransferase trr-like n=1 Tax=Plectropomus leopardus TaxID=160734 RepID=UPI001C4BF444